MALPHCGKRARYHNVARDRAIPLLIAVLSLVPPSTRVQALVYAAGRRFPRYTVSITTGRAVKGPLTTKTTYAAII